MKMKWIGKVAGGLLGAVALGPIGAAIGVLLGHQFDEHSDELQRGPATPERLAAITNPVLVAVGENVDIAVNAERLGPLRTTRHELKQALESVAQLDYAPHLEVETYTWDMLPESAKSNDIVDYICRELDWVKGQLV